MAANPISDFDLGPLTWVKTEIDHSLGQAREHLDKLAASPADRAPVKYILTHLHQATGALAMVGLGAATRFNEELERLVAFLQDEEASRLPAAVAVAKRGIGALSGYLDTLLAGQADHPMRLLAPFVELNRARGANDAGEGDLFYPNLDAALPMPAPSAPALDEPVLAKALAHQRAQYQQGLLRMLKGGEATEALRQMHAAIGTIESLSAGGGSRAFWTAAAAFFDALVFGGLEITPAVKPLFAKLDQQIKQTIDGAGKVAERLFRDLLLAVARSRPVSERITLLKEVYRLEPLIGVPDAVRGSEDEALAGAVRDLRELTAQQKDTWLKYTSGNRAALEPFGRQALVLAERSARLPNRDAQSVLARLAEIAPVLKARAIPPSDGQALEVATALLFIEAALENYFALGAEFARQARMVSDRVKRAMAGEPLPPMESLEGGLLDEMTRRAQEKLLIFQVGQEVQVNLQNIEQVLDGFFRDASRRGELAALPGQFAQVQGALMIMELDEAAALTAAVMSRVQQFAEGSLPGGGEAADLVAEGLSALGLYVAALQQGSASAADTLVPALVRFGLLERPVEIEDEVRRTGTVAPVDIDVQKQKVQALYEDWKEAPAEETRARLERAVGDLQRDAAVAADGVVVRQSGEALDFIRQAQAPEQTGVFNAILGLAPDKAPEVPTPQMVQLVDAPGAEVDRELLEIFLEEAADVAGTVALNLEACRESPHDREALTTIRRGFHTLKGSGRMVGLTELGEMAWQCEQVMNKWLKEERPASPALIEFIGLAHESFLGWVQALRDSGVARIDDGEIRRRAEALKSDQPTDEPAAPDVAGMPGDAPAEAVAESPVQDPPSEEAPAAGQPPGFAFESLDLAASAPADREEAIAPEPPLADFDFSSQLPARPPLPPEVQFPEPSLEENEVVVADVRLGSTLFNIYLGEAEEHIATLDREMARLEADPLEPVAADFMRAAHTLASTSRTTGFTPVAELAAALEKWLAEAIELPPEFDAARLSATRNAVEALRAMVESVRGRAMPYPRDEVVAAIDALRQGLREGRRTGEGTHIRMPSLMQEVPQPPAEASTPEAEAEASPASIASNEAPAEAPRIAAPAETAAEERLEFVEQAPASEAPASQPEAEPLAEEPLFDWAQDAPQAGSADPQPAAQAPAEQPLLEFGEEAPPAEALPEQPLVEFAEEASPAEALPEPPPLEFVEEAPPAAALAVEAVPPVAQDDAPPEPQATPAVVEVAVAEEKPSQPAAFEAGKDQRKILDDVDRDLLPVFLEEAREILPLVSEAVRRWKASPADHSPAAGLQRQLHTLKGSARMTGLMRLGELAHILEARVNAIDEVDSPPAHEFEEIEERVDRFSASLERLSRGEDMLEAEPIAVPVSAVFEHQKDKPAPLAVIAAAAQEKAERDALPPELREARSALLRVNAEMIDRFVNEAGELSIARSRIELEMAAFRRAMADLTDNIGRMRTQLREIEIAAESQMQSTIKAKEDSGETFDPLEFDRFSRMQELTRFLAESLSDVMTLHQGLQKNLDDVELATNAQARLNRDLQQGLMGVRLVPFGNLSDRFYRVVRQTAKELDKKANLELKGTRTELDRSVLEKITGPFEHLLRNAIVHGLEAPAERARAGKPEIGEISVEAVQRGNEVVLTVSDDGAGLNFARIRAKAVEAGLLAADVEPPEAQLAQFIFMPGFSTASEVTQVAGRGVGMDVVKNEITSLGGRVEIASAPGRGTVFTITLPLTLAVTQAVMMRAGSTVYAVPSVMVEQVQEFKSQAYAETQARGEIEWKGNRYALRSLLPLLGEVDTPPPARQIPVLLLKSGVQRAAIRVDEVLGNREVVVKTIGPQLARLAGLAGATVLGNGQVVLILNPVQLVHREQPAFEPLRPAAVAAGPAPAQRSLAPLVMVVDDSLTVRKITGRMLAREGYEVASAKDGIDALQQLQEVRPDCILLDVEMPRMDGFEFARNVRADAGTRDIPIIMITSRTADKHRNHALEIGVNEYMGKPYQEDELLALIRRYTREPAAA